jgi:hypothetical protein
MIVPYASHDLISWPTAPGPQHLPAAETMQLLHIQSCSSEDSDLLATTMTQSALAYTSLHLAPRCSSPGKHLGLAAGRRPCRPLGPSRSRWQHSTALDTQPHALHCVQCSAGQIQQPALLSLALDSCSQYHLCHACVLTPCNFTYLQGMKRYQARVAACRSCLLCPRVGAGCSQ